MILVTPTPYRSISVSPSTRSVYGVITDMRDYGFLITQIAIFANVDTATL